MMVGRYCGFNSILEAAAFVSRGAIRLLKSNVGFYR
jgi:hypothetical protein